MVAVAGPPLVILRGPHAAGAVAAIAVGGAVAVGAAAKSVLRINSSKKSGN